MTIHKFGWVKGCGGIAKGKHLPSLSELDQVELVAFCDIVLERAHQAAEKYGVVRAKVYENYTYGWLIKGSEVV